MYRVAAKRVLASKPVLANIWNAQYAQKGERPRQRRGLPTHHRPVEEGPVGGFTAPLCVPAALLGGPAFGLFEGDMPWLGPLFPVVLPFIELPVVVELAACPPEAELPPAVAPAPDPPL